MISHPLTLALFALTHSVVHAASSISSVIVYPGSASIDRVATVEAGSKQVVFDCLPAGIDQQSLQFSADADVSVGEMSIKTVEREASNCATHPLDQQIKVLEDQKAALQAEFDALDLVKGYLKSVSGSDNSGTSTRIDNRSVAATVETLRKSGQDTNLRQYQLTQKMNELDRQLEPLNQERGRAQSGGKVITVRASLYTTHASDVHLRYQVRNANWTPTYRAVLDSASGRLRIERKAQVMQATGEDWSGVKLTLSTGQPRVNTEAPMPYSWFINITPPPRAESASYAYAPPAPAPMPVAAPIARLSSSKSLSNDEAPDFTVNVVNYPYNTSFNIPGRIDVPTSGQSVAFVLGQYDAHADLFVRTTPSRSTDAFLMATLPRPDGIWPQGQMELFRDNAFVGSTRLNFDSDDHLELSLGQDEMVSVTAEPVKTNEGQTTFGGRRERHVIHGYTVQNRHSLPIKLEVLEAAPVAQNDEVRITTQFDPKPVDTEWQQRPGITRWYQSLGAGKTVRFSGDYLISVPKDADVRGW